MKGNHRRFLFKFKLETTRFSPKIFQIWEHLRTTILNNSKVQFSLCVQYRHSNTKKGSFFYQIITKLSANPTLNLIHWIWFCDWWDMNGVFIVQINEIRLFYWHQQLTCKMCIFFCCRPYECSQSIQIYIEKTINKRTN